MFTSETPDEKVFAVKPMSFPGCVQVFNQGLKSYRDLPLKLSQRRRMSQFIFMVIGMIFVEVLIYLRQVKSESSLN